MRWLVVHRFDGTMPATGDSPMHETSSPKRPTHDSALHITMQFRILRGMAYELNEAGNRLTVMITESGNSAPAQRWTVEAFGGATREAAITRTASTRAEALRQAGSSWSDARHERGLHPFDWEAVARALAVVRAI
jgi:hypothetical protein